MDSPQLATDAIKRQLEAALLGIISRVKARTGCKCRVGTELVAAINGAFRVNVWGILPCRIHLAASSWDELEMVREIQADFEAQVGRGLSPRG